MSHADDYIRAVHAEISGKYPAVPKILHLSDEPAGDFGIAHFYGLSRDDGGAILSFDSGYQPGRRTVIHELGHAVHAVGGEEFLRRYWVVRGFPLSIEDANAEALRLQNEGQAFASWSRWPMESFAEDFACLEGTFGPITHDWGVPLGPRLGSVRALFASFRPATQEEEELTQEYKEALQKELHEKAYAPLTELQLRYGALEERLERLEKEAGAPHQHPIRINAQTETQA